MGIIANGPAWTLGAILSRNLPKRAVAYVRVSTAREEMLSPELQAHEIRVWAARNGVDVVETVEDLDLSGRDFGKRSLSRIIAGIESGMWDGVLLWKWSRWGRNLLQSRIYLAEVDAAGGTVVAVTEDFDTETSVGKFTRDQMLAIAELQSNQISEGWKETHDRRRRLGLPAQGQRRWGYQKVAAHTDDAGRTVEYVPDPVTAPALRGAYERYVNGQSMSVIAADLNRRGFRTLRGGLWEARNLGRMMDTGFAAGLIREHSNPKYGQPKHIGAYDVWRDGSQEPLITREMWEAYKAIRVSNQEGAPRDRFKYALSGLLVCHVCGGTMYPGGGRVYGGASWRCNRAATLKDHKGVTIGNFKAEEIVLQWLDNQAQGGDDFEERVRRAQRAEKRSTDTQRLKAEVKRLTDRLERQREMREDGEYTREEYRERSGRTRDQLSTALANLAEAEREAAQDASVNPRVFKTLAEAWPHLGNDVKREALSKVIGFAIVYPGNGNGPDKLRVVGAWDVEERPHLRPGSIYAARESVEDATGNGTTSAEGA